MCRRLRQDQCLYGSQVMPPSLARPSGAFRIPREEQQQLLFCCLTTLAHQKFPAKKIGQGRRIRKRKENTKTHRRVCQQVLLDQEKSSITHTGRTCPARTRAHSSCVREHMSIWISDRSTYACNLSTYVCKSSRVKIDYKYRWVEARKIEERDLKRCIAVSTE